MSLESGTPDDEKTMQRVPSKHKNSSVAREAEPGAVIKLVSLLACGLVLAGGFVYAGGRHFAALRIGYETQKLRSELDNAREEQRRLALEREAAASPVRLERVARQLGMQPILPSQIDPLNLRAEKPAPMAVRENQSTGQVPTTAKAKKETPIQKTRR